MTIQWDSADHVVVTTGEKFMSPVLRNAARGSSIRFGIMGSGTAPNYQVERPDRAPMLFKGNGHKEWLGDTGIFKAENLSAAFAYEDLYTAFTSHFRSPLKNRI